MNTTHRVPLFNSNGQHCGYEGVFSILRNTYNDTN